MFYYLLEFIAHKFNFPGHGLYQYISVRAFCAVVLSIYVTIFFSQRIINKSRKNSVFNTNRELGIAADYNKNNIPTFGGGAIILGILIPTILFTKIFSTYIIILIVSTILLGIIGFIDDYIKVFLKQKKGLASKTKLVGQIIVGCFVGAYLYIHNGGQSLANDQMIDNQSVYEESLSRPVLKTNMPFLKNNQFDYSYLNVFNKKYSWIVYIFAVIFIICAVSNGLNLVDGLDGLAAGSSAIIGSTLAVLAYLSGNLIFANYLNIMYIPTLGEVVIFVMAFVGACIGFLWYNTFPAQIFMGDFGSLSLGGIIAIVAVIIKKELLLPLICGVMVIENLSVITQVLFFKYTKKKYGVGKRVFACAPIHHHYQLKGLHEAKIVTRFFIVGIIFSFLALVTLKLR